MRVQRGYREAGALGRLRQGLARLHLRGDRLRARLRRQHKLFDTAVLTRRIVRLVLIIIGADLRVARRRGLRETVCVNHGIADAALFGDGEAVAVLLVKVSQLRVGRVLVVQEGDGRNSGNLALPRFEQQGCIGQHQIFRGTRADADGRQQLALQDFAADIVAQRLFAQPLARQESAEIIIAEIASRILKRRDLRNLGVD